MTPGKSLHAASATLHVQKRKTATIIGAKSQLDPSKARTCYSPVLTRQAVSLVRGYGHVSRSYELMEDYDDSDNDHVEESEGSRMTSLAGTDMPQMIMNGRGQTTIHETCICAMPAR